MKRFQTDVLVCGAGFSGLAAARGAGTFTEA